MSLIINSPFEYPARHHRERTAGQLEIVEERRPASYEVFDARNNTKRTVTLDLVNVIRERVNEWRAADYPGVTIITRKLLEHWNDPTARQYQFYFCQLEAIETLIWWVEGAEAYKQGIHIPGDGGPWPRLCNKMATGAGKTTVMAMIITWQVLNALTYPKRNKDFSRAIFIVAPGLTVKERLQVLYPNEGSYYDEFNLCPSDSMRQKLNQAEVLVENWHTLMPLKEQVRSVVKKGDESDEAFTRRVLGKLANYKDIVVINDEAHHAYRKPAEVKISKKDAEAHGIDLEEATRWISGLDRIHKTRRIQCCFDLSATPFAPTGKKTTDTALFDWIVSDFGLNDAIEAGLVKTPRIVVRDDALPDSQTLRSKLYHLYRDPSVSEDLNRASAKPHEALPKLVKDAYTLLGADWRAYLQEWEGHHSPPVMLTVCNRTETAARIEHYFNSGDAYWPELKAPEKTLRVDSKVLEKAESGEAAQSDKDYEAKLHSIIDATPLPETKRRDLKGLKKEELLREIVDNVGKRGGAGQALQNVISVAMLSEGWDAKNVTHIMGLRAFTSQLLCEQVVGRGLRRVSYDKDENGLFVPEYVNVFGVPLTISETGDAGEAPPPPKPSTQIEVVAERRALELTWPNVVRIEAVTSSVLEVDWAALPKIELDPATTPLSADLAPALGGAADLSAISVIDLESLPDEFRLQRLIFQATRKAVAEIRAGFRGTDEYLASQLVRLVERYINSDRIVVPSLFHQEQLRRRILIGLNIDQIVQELVSHVRQRSVEKLEPIYDDENPIGSTGRMRTWFTSKPCQPTLKSHISHVVGDSSWEGLTGNLCERVPQIVSYAKNDHLGFHIQYLWNGSRRRFVPDFLIRYESGLMLVLEIKGEDSQQNQAKRAALDEWVQAINTVGTFGRWVANVAFQPAEIEGILHAYS
jgi:type III restriction enzyme